MSTLYPLGVNERLAVEESLQVNAEAAWRPDGPTKARPGSVVLAVTTDSGVRVEAHLRADDPLLPDLLARRATRVRDVAEGVVLPEPHPHPFTPRSALRDDVAPVYTLTLEDA